MVPTATIRKEVREVITELHHLLNDIKWHGGQAAQNERTLDSLYKLKAKAGEAIKLLKEQDALAPVEPASTGENSTSSTRDSKVIKP